jgi:RND family efflux transporter MFP subunit
MRNIRIHSAQQWPLLAGAALAVLLGGCSPSAPTDGLFMGYIEDTQVNVTTRMPGRVTDIFVDEGAPVAAGQKVAQLDDSSMVANLRALKRQRANIDKNRHRLEQLYAVGAIPEQKLDEIETAYDVLTDRMMALASNVNDMTIRSPIDGRVDVRVLEPGEMMSPGMPIVVVSDTCTSWARFSIPETYLPQVRVGGAFTLTTGMDTPHPRAVVVQILPMADFATKLPTNLQDQRDIRSFSVRMKLLDHRTELAPGVSVYLSLKPPAEAGGDSGARP